MGHTAMIAPVTPTVYRPLGPKKRTHRTNDTIWRAFSYALIAGGGLIAALSPIFSGRESQRRRAGAGRGGGRPAEEGPTFAPRGAPPNPPPGPPQKHGR